MDREHVKGTADKVKGQIIKDTAGKVTGDKKLESEGKLDKAKGSAHNVAGDLKDAVKETSKQKTRTDHATKAAQLSGFFLSLTKPPRVWVTYRLAHVQGKETLYAPDDGPNDPPKQNQNTDCKMKCQKSQEKIQKTNPKCRYLKLEM